MNKKYIMILIILISSFLFLSQNIYPVSDKDYYDLQERCGKRCDEFFMSRYNIDRSEVCGHKNHYNKKIKKCFILVSCTLIIDDGGENMELEDIIDVNENKTYASFVQRGNDISTCKVFGKNCVSKKEWEKLVKPYMEE